MIVNTTMANKQQQEKKEEIVIEDQAENQKQEWLDNRDKNVELTSETLTPREFDVDTDGNIVLPSDLREKLKEEIANGYIFTSSSEDGKYVMLKYSKSVMFEQRWNEVTVNFRGVLTDADYNRVYARSFSKFFNVAEHESREGFPELPKHEKVVLAKKMDGSLGIITHIDGENRVFTSGSGRRESNDIAVEGEKILAEVISAAGQENWTPPKGVTVLAEIISPVNPIVLDYKGDRRLVCLSAVDNRTGKDLSSDKVREIFPGEHVEKINDGVAISYDRAISEPIPVDEEGFVLEFQDSKIKAKVKGDNYLKAHKITTNMSVNYLHETMENGEDEELLERVRSTAPERAYLMLSQARAKILEQRDAKLAEREAVANQAIANYNAKHNSSDTLAVLATDIPSEKMGLFIKELRELHSASNSVKSDFTIDIELSKGKRDRAIRTIMKNQRPHGKTSIVSLFSAEEVEVGDAADDEVGR